MNRRKSRVDANHTTIRDGLRRVPGMAVKDLSHVGGGVPDLLCSFRGRLLFLEVKDGAKVPSARRLRVTQERFLERFPEHTRVVLSLDDALREMGVT
jgi:hypothetical protein